MRLNVKTKLEPIFTHEGGKASRVNFDEQLRRTVMACLLWEKNFYESGEDIASRIKELIPKVAAEKVYSLAIEARTKMKLRHVPLLLAREMARYPSHKSLIAKLLPQIILRADELAEFVAIYWETQEVKGKKTLSAQVKKGLAKAFHNFDEYQFAKYDRDNKVKLRDVLFLCHSKPKDSVRPVKLTRMTKKYIVGEKGLQIHYQPFEEIYRKIAQRELTTPDTWEVALSAGADKKATFERLMSERKLYDMAFLRNLRNMLEAGIEPQAIADYGRSLKFSMVLPFRFISAAKMVPVYENIIEQFMFKCCESRQRLNNTTIILVDNSGSMSQKLSAKSIVDRADVACGLAILATELCDNVHVFSFSENLSVVPPRRGFALRDAILASQTPSGTYFAKALSALTAYVKQNAAMFKNLKRLIVISDEQCHDNVTNVIADLGNIHRYMINVANNRNGVAYDLFTHINGWSEAILDYIVELEKASANVND